MWELVYNNVGSRKGVIFTTSLLYVNIKIIVIFLSLFFLCDIESSSVPLCVTLKKELQQKDQYKLTIYKAMHNVIREKLLIKELSSWIAVVTLTDRPKSVRNRCVIEGFGGVSCCHVALKIFCGCRGICHRNDSDIFLFLSLDYSSIPQAFCKHHHAMLARVDTQAKIDFMAIVLNVLRWTETNGKNKLDFFLARCWCLCKKYICRSFIVFMLLYLCFFVLRAVYLFCVFHRLADLTSSFHLNDISCK